MFFTYVGHTEASVLHLDCFITTKQLVGQRQNQHHNMYVRLILQAAPLIKNLAIIWSWST